LDSQHSYYMLATYLATLALS